MRAAAQRATASLAAAALAACSAGPAVTTWGTMREALRLGHSEARVTPTEVATAHTIGVGALAGLAGEVTIVDGDVLIAAPTNATTAPLVRPATAADRATLLIAAEVPAWRELPLGACASYAELEQRVAEHLVVSGLDLRQPQPVRVTGRATALRLHAIAGACPIARPDGPAPWRFDGDAERVELVGVFVEGAAARLTHHDRRSHLHAVASGGAAGDLVMGHLDEVALHDAVLLLPR
ncbi:MAG: hypothetical protein H6835_03605 [Planctomycetes bacterium]|nr:hypothetical protein [Planctomycetota bacterium]